MEDDPLVAPDCTRLDGTCECKSIEECKYASYKDCRNPQGCVYCGGECPYMPAKSSHVQDGKCSVQVEHEGSRGKTTQSHQSLLRDDFSGCVCKLPTVGSLTSDEFMRLCNVMYCPAGAYPV